jgi:multiple sugar transport system permease protein/putative spermidine/putrescine transport system permease protein
LKPLLLFGALALGMGLPLALLALWSITARWPAEQLLPTSYTLDHWREVFATGGLGLALAQSLLIAAGVVALTGTLAIPAAWALAKAPLSIRQPIELTILIPAIVPGVVIAINVAKIFAILGLQYTSLGVILAQTLGAFPLATRLLTATFEGVSDDIVAASRLLGAGPLRVALFVILPLSARGLFAAALLSFFHSFEEFEKAFVVGAPLIETLPVKLYAFLDPYALNMPKAAVVALMLLAPALLVFVALAQPLRNAFVSKRQPD